MVIQVRTMKEENKDAFDVLSQLLGLSVYHSMRVYIPGGTPFTVPHRPGQTFKSDGCMYAELCGYEDGKVLAYIGWAQLRLDPFAVGYIDKDSVLLTPKRKEQVMSKSIIRGTDYE